MEILNSAGGALVTDRMSIAEENTPINSRLDVVIDTAFTMTIRIKAYTMAKNNYITLNVRVCGAETIALANSATRFFIDGIETGNPVGMPDSQRYYIINEATFSSWFVVSPAGDACSIKRYEIWKTNSPDTAITGTQVLLTGALGSY